MALRILVCCWLLIACSTAAMGQAADPPDAKAVARRNTLEEVKKRGELIWGGDAEGGGPYVFPDPNDPNVNIGFEVDLANAIAEEMGVKARFFQGNWDNLPALLGTEHIDIILNGYELTGARAGMMDHTINYYIYELALMGRKNNQDLRDWEDLRKPINGRKARVAVLGSSSSDTYLQNHFADDVEIVRYESNTDGMREVETGKIDATVLDLPIATFYRDRFAELEVLGKPRSPGYYTIYLRQGDDALKVAINHALTTLIESGKLRAIYEKYGLWNETQEGLIHLISKSDADLGIHSTQLRGWEVIRSRGPLLVKAAGVTIVLACLSMPLAIIIGLLVAIGRLYGPALLRWILMIYVEVLRGTPLMLQLFVIFYLLPEIGLPIPAFWAAIIGLSINYSAYEAEIYRAGLQAIPRGQMEAALALGMSPALAVRRIIVPQAVRIVVPPVTNDFIAMFKDTSVCSAITVIELTKQYSMQRNATGATLELAALTAILYLLMSVPLSHLTARMEKRMRERTR